jgi:hypothetical protein
MSKRQQYYFSIDDFTAARGDDAELGFDGRSPDALAAAVQEALRTSSLFERWRARQKRPDEVDPALAPVDPQATAHAAQADLHVDLKVVTDLPMHVLRQRLGLLIGNHWALRDVR